MSAIIGAFIAASAIATAAQAGSAIQLYDQGRYEQAITTGVAENNAAGFAVAARAELAREMMRDEPCLDCLKRAEAYAERSIAADPRPAEGHIYLAVTLGYEARIIGMISARFKGYAEKAKVEIDDALASDPRNAWAWAALGGWHIEIVHGGGKTLANWLYGATVADGLEDFRKSFAYDPDNLVLRAQYAITLAAYDRERFHSEIESALTKAVTLHPRTAYDGFAQSRARTLLSTLNGGDMAAFDRLVRHDQGYP
jgi:tetratricopeptide (TPR) repeat protein